MRAVRGWRLAAATLATCGVAAFMASARNYVRDSADTVSKDGESWWNGREWAPFRQST